MAEIPPIFRALIDGDRVALIELARDPALVNCRWSSEDGSWADQGLTPFIVAARLSGARTEDLSILLNAGAEIDARSENGSTALSSAAGDPEASVFEPDLGPAKMSDSLDRIRLLLGAGARFQILKNGETPISIAAESGDPARLRLLLEALPSKRRRFLLGRRDDYRSPVHQAARSGSAECVGLLLDAGVPLGPSILEAAASPSVVRLVVSRGVAGDRVSCLAWLNALEEGYFDVARELLVAGFDPNGTWGDRWNVFHSTAAALQPEGLRLLLEFGADPMHVSEDGQTALHVAAWIGQGSYNGPPPHQHQETIRVLVAAGIDPNARDANWQTPLHDAAGGDWGAPIAVRTLLELGADSSPVDRRGDTPLRFAIREGDSESVRALLEYGAWERIDGSEQERLHRFAKSVAWEAARELLAKPRPWGPTPNHYSESKGQQADEAEELVRLLEGKRAV